MRYRKEFELQQIIAKKKNAINCKKTLQAK